MDAGLTSIFSKCRALSRVAILVVCFDLSVCSALASRLVSLFSFVQFFLPIFFHHVSLFMCALSCTCWNRIQSAMWSGLTYACLMLMIASRGVAYPPVPRTVAGVAGLLSTLYPQGEAGVWHPAWVPNHHFSHFLSDL